MSLLVEPLAMEHLVDRYFCLVAVLSVFRITISIFSPSFSALQEGYECRNQLILMCELIDFLLFA